MAERGYRTIEKANDGTRWANPDIYPKALKRTRKLLYRRHTVERLSARIEERDRLIRRMRATGKR